MWANRGYILLAILVFLVALIVQTPLQFVWPKLQPHLSNLPVNLSQVKGSVWQGQANVQTQVVGFDSIKVDWNVSAWSLLKLQLKLNLKLASQGLLVQGNAQANSSKRISISELNGYLDSQILQPILHPLQIQLGGDFNLHEATVELEMKDNQPIIHNLKGQLVYSGGRVGFPVDGNPIQSELPTLLGLLGKEGEKAVLNLTTNDDLAVGEGFIQSDGWAGMAVKRRLLDVMNQPWPAKADADTVIFQVSQKVF